MVRSSKKLYNEKGLLAVPGPKQGHSIDPILEKKIIDFYLDPINSRIMPAKKDYKSVKTAAGTREHRQKRLLLLNLKDLHQAFLEAYKDESDKVSLSKFGELRPRECILAGASGTHVVCVCEIHENFKKISSSW